MYTPVVCMTRPAIAACEYEMSEIGELRFRALVFDPGVLVFLTCIGLISDESIALLSAWGNTA